MTPEEYIAYIAETKKPRKYRNVPTEIDGLRFASKREGGRWLVLRQMERDRKIKNLRRQVPFLLVVNGELVAKYLADYVYDRDGKQVVEDSKGGVRTDVYRLKKRLMRACLGIEILET